MSLKDLLIRYKPGVSIRSHLVLAALIWTIVGSALMIIGIYWAYEAGHLLYGLSGVLLGTAKSYFILDRVARKNIRRIEGFEGKVCFGSVYSWKTWLLVGGMIGLGRFLRTTVLSSQVAGLIYAAVGWGLLLSSRLMWKTWISNSK